MSKSLFDINIQRNGQASVLTDEQLRELMSVLSAVDRLVLGICYYTSCRIREALQLTRVDVVEVVSDSVYGFKGTLC